MYVIALKNDQLFSTLLAVEIPRVCSIEEIKASTDPHLLTFKTQVFKDEEELVQASNLTCAFYSTQKLAQEEIEKYHSLLEVESKLLKKQPLIDFKVVEVDTAKLPSQIVYDACLTDKETKQMVKQMKEVYKVFVKENN